MLRKSGDESGGLVAVGYQVQIVVLAGLLTQDGVVSPAPVKPDAYLRLFEAAQNLNHVGRAEVSVPLARAVSLARFAVPPRHQIAARFSRHPLFLQMTSGAACGMSIRSASASIS